MVWVSGITANPRAMLRRFARESSSSDGHNSMSSASSADVLPYVLPKPTAKCGFSGESAPLSTLLGGIRLIITGDCADFLRVSAHSALRPAKYTQQMSPSTDFPPRWARAHRKDDSAATDSRNNNSSPPDRPRRERGGDDREVMLARPSLW